MDVDVEVDVDVDVDVDVGGVAERLGGMRIFVKVLRRFYVEKS